MQTQLARTVAPMALVVLLAACGGSTEEVTTSPAADETTTTGAPSDSTGTTGPSNTVPGQSTESSAGPATSTGSGGGTPTTKSPPRTPGTPVTGPLVTPPPVRATDPYLPAGVPDQVNPPGTNASKLLTTGQCGPLLRQIRGPITPAEAPTTVTWKEGEVPESLTNLYIAAGEACLANWKPARDAFLKVKTAELCETDPDSGELLAATTSFPSAADCRNTRLGVYRWTENLLKAHAANPAFVPNFKPPPKR